MSDGRDNWATDTPAMSAAERLSQTSRDADEVSLLLKGVADFVVMHNDRQLPDILFSALSYAITRQGLGTEERYQLLNNIIDTANRPNLQDTATTNIINNNGTINGNISELQMSPQRVALVH